MSLKMLFGILVLSVSAAGCPAADSVRHDASPKVAPTSGHAEKSPDRPVMIPVEQAGANVVLSDPVRRARAFENGPVGRPRPLPIIGSGDPPPDPEPTVEPPFLIVTPNDSGSLMLSYRCNTAGTTLVRSGHGGTQALSVACPSLVNGRIETGLQPGRRYCYTLSGVGSACARTPYVFAGPGLSQAESNQMLADFRWWHTEPVVASYLTSSGATHPALYSMNILVKSVDDLYALRQLGMHTQAEPLFSDEKAAWDGKIRKAMSPDGSPAGVWISAIVPGAVYNDLRSQGIARGWTNNRSAGIRAMVFRRIPSGAAYYSQAPVVTPLSLSFLGQQGLTFNGEDPIVCDETASPRTCQIQSAILGWLANKVITLAADIVHDTVSLFRQGIGAFETVVRGDVSMVIKVGLTNADELFGTGEPVRSAWRGGTPLTLKGLKVKVYQGYVAEFDGELDDQGSVTLGVAKNLSGKVCLLLENQRVKIIDTFAPREVCVGGFAATSTPQTTVLSTSDRFANELALMTDAADYLKTVMSFDMAQVSVLTGWQSSLSTGLNGGRSFTPCLGRMPNLAANLAIYSQPFTPLFGEIAEFVTSYDIILTDDDALSRGVGVHEYGHATMCELLRNVDQVKASEAWADVMLASMSGQDPSSQPAIIAEGFADFIALQVAGGTNYFTGAATRYSRSMNYCTGESTRADLCVEANFRRCDQGTCTRENNIGWATSVLQDTFDHVPDAAEQANPSIALPNDGSHWTFDGTKLVPHHASNQVSAMESDTIHLSGFRIRDIFSAWGESGSLLRYTSFFGGLAKALKRNGFDLASSCAMFATHEPSGGCPTYFIDAHNSAAAPSTSSSSSGGTDDGTQCPLNLPNCLPL